MINKIITKKSVVLVFIFVLFYSLSVSGYVLEDEVYSEKVIADSLAFEKAQQSAGAKAGVRTLSLASSSPIIIWGETLNSIDTYTDKYKPLEVYRQGSESYVRRYMKNFFPSRHRYASSWIGPNGYDLPYAYESYCWWSDSLPGLICDMKFRLPNDAPVGTYIVRRVVYDRQTGEQLYSRISYNYMIFNPYNPDTEEGGLDSSSIKSYAYDPSRGGRDEIGVWFFPQEFKSGGRWKGREYGLRFILHPYDEYVFKQTISQIDGETSAESAANKLRTYTSNHLVNDASIEHRDTNELRTSGTHAQCADQANFLVESLRSIGIPSRPVAVDMNIGQTDNYWNFHTWTEIWTKRRTSKMWAALDAFLETDASDRSVFGTLKNTYGKQINDLILVARSDWDTSKVTLRIKLGDDDADMNFTYNPGNEKLNPYCSVPAQNFDKSSYWISELSQVYWGEPYWNPRSCSTPKPYDIMITTDKETYSVGELMFITVNVSSNLDVESMPLVRGEVLEQIPFMKVPVKKVLYSFERNINLLPYGSYQFVEYYNVSEGIVTTDSFNIVVEAENASNVAFFGASSLMGLEVDAPTDVAQDEPFVVGVKVSNNQTGSLMNIKVAMELPYNLQSEEPLVKDIPLLLSGESKLVTWSLAGISPGYTELIFNVFSENGGIDKVGALVKVKGYPELFTNFSAPSSAGVGEEFDVSAEIFNVGGLTAEGVTATLSLSPNLTTSESLTKTVGNIGGGSSTSVTWSVKSSEEDFYYMKVDVSDATGKYTSLSGSSINITKKSPYELKLEALNKLKEMRTGNEPRFDKAISALESSLNREYWVDDYILKLGKVFDYEKEAVQELMEIAK